MGYDAERMGKTWKVIRIACYCLTCMCAYIQAMEDLVEKGLVRAIGISNFSITKTENLLKTANIVPAVIQGINRHSVIH